MAHHLKNSENPLKHLVGKWSGTGDDIAPGPGMEKVVSPYKEEMTIEDVGVVDNHMQFLNCYRYSTRVYRASNQNLFHEEEGYLLWDKDTKKLMRSFVIPRGVAVHAEGEAGQRDNEFTLKAESGQGIGLSSFLKENFELIAFEVTYSFIAEDQWNYRQLSTLKIKGEKGLFEHTDQAVMKRIL